MADQAVDLAPGGGAKAAAGAARLFTEKAQPYAYYALLLLVFANFFNYVDRQIMGIVAHAIQKDLGFSDAHLGFLLGTAFAVLYGVVGIAMGRISDVISRTRLMAAGLALWSGMTALSGFAVNFAGLAAARIGVGIGEAVANPCSHSLIADYFPARVRSAAFGTYMLGTHFGAAASLFLGGLILERWDEMCLSLPAGACGVANWQAAFLAVGIPGVLLAFLIASLREPPRPKLEPTTSVARVVAREMSAAVPPFTLFNLFQIGGWPATLRNLALAGVLIGGALTVGWLTGDWPQWIAVGIGVYSVSTWGQVLSKRDRPLFKLTFGCPTFALMLSGAALMACFTGTVHMWSVPYAMRELGVAPSKVGLYLGLASAVSSGLAVTVGGFLTDRWKRRDVRAPIWVGMIALLGPIPALVVMLRTVDFDVFVAGYFVFTLLCMGWAGGFASLVQDLVLPRMRGTASAQFSLVVILVASGIGPYWAGKISTLTGSLTTGLYSLLILVPVSAAIYLLAAARLKHETPETRRARARAAGEAL